MNVIIPRPNPNGESSPGVGKVSVCFHDVYTFLFMIIRPGNAGHEKITKIR